MIINQTPDSPKAASPSFRCTVFNPKIASNNLKQVRDDYSCLNHSSGSVDGALGLRIRSLGCDTSLGTIMQPRRIWIAMLSAGCRMQSYLHYVTRWCNQKVSE